MSNFDLLQP